MSDYGYAQIKNEILQALQQGDLTADHYALGCYLAQRADHRNGYRIGVMLTTLKAELGWNCSVDTIARRLVDLRTHGFIAYEVAERQRTPYSITVTEKLVRQPKKTAANAAMGTAASSDAAPPGNPSSEAGIPAATTADFSAARTTSQEREKDQNHRRRDTKTARASVDLPLSEAVDLTAETEAA